MKKISFDQAVKEAHNTRVIISPKSKNPYKCIYTCYRIERDTVPAGWHVYEIRETDDGNGDWATVEDHVLVNFGGSLLTRYSIKYTKGKDYFDLFNNKKWGRYTWREEYN